MIIYYKWIYFREQALIFILTYKNLRNMLHVFAFSALKLFAMTDENC
jgi:hypothetical protein